MWYWAGDWTLRLRPWTLSKHYSPSHLILLPIWKRESYPASTFFFTSIDTISDLAVALLHTHVIIFAIILISHHCVKIYRCNSKPIYTFSNQNIGNNQIKTLKGKKKFLSGVTKVIRHLVRAASQTQLKISHLYELLMCRWNRC